MTNGSTTDDDGGGESFPARQRRHAPWNLEELREQARDLRRAVAAGEPEAFERVLRSHPKYVDRPAERLRWQSITLRDAQETVARERAGVGWAELVHQLENSGDASPRWDARAQIRLEARIVMFAGRTGAAHATAEHVLDALASPPEPTVAARVLGEVGFEPGTMESGKGKAAESTASTPAQQALIAAATGVAIGLGAPTVTDEHVLLALAFSEIGIALLRERNLDPDEVVAALVAAGVPVPRMAPPVPTLPPGPAGPRVYFRGRGEGLAPELLRRYPPGTVHIGFNTSAWKPGWGWVDAEDEVPLEEIVRSVIEDPADVEVVPLWDAVEAESPRSRVIESSSTRPGG
jgi:hypothetical protein